MIRRLIATGLFAVGMTAPAFGQSITVVTTMADFESGVEAISGQDEDVSVQETFMGNVFSSPLLDLPSPFGGDFRIVNDRMQAVGGRAPQGAALQFTEISFADPIIGFGFDFGGGGTGQEFTAGISGGEVMGIITSSAISAPAAAGFLGLVSSTPFTTVRIDDLTFPTLDTRFIIDNFKIVLATDDEEPPIGADVPLPAGLPLLLTGVAGIALLRRKAKRA